MNFSVKISSLILLMMIICNKLSNEETIPKFCDTPKIEGIYNFGYELKIRFDKWIWTYNFTSQSMIEPPIEELILTQIKSLRVLTTLFISRVAVGPPDRPCMEGMNQMECDKQLKADQLMFIRVLDTNTDIEFTDVVRFTKGIIQKVSPHEYPWNLGPDANCWPQEWNNDKNNTRSSAYSNSQMQSYFIINSGNSGSSELLYNRIITNDWYKHFVRVPLKSDVKFVGMFFYHLDGFVYAVGDRAQDPVSLMYRLEKSSSDGLFFLNKTNEEVRSFFKCKNIVTNTSTHGEEQAYNEADKYRIAFIGIAVIVLIVVIALIVYTIVFALIRGGRSAGQTYQVSDDDRTSSIISGNSYSGKPSLRSKH